MSSSGKIPHKSGDVEKRRRRIGMGGRGDDDNDSVDD
jgi:hypothetical protein